MTSPAMPPSGTPFDQAGYRCRLEWGRDGARRAAARGDSMVVVDTLSFSTTVATAASHGGIIHPCAWDETPGELAEHAEAEIAVRRGRFPADGRFSLSPLTFIGMEPGTVVVLASPNGATCSRLAEQVPHLIAGALVNARAVGTAVSSLLGAAGANVTVVAAGEQWENPEEDGGLRVAVEDYLGAGAIIAHISATKSPEAVVCEGAFLAARSRLGELLAACGSGLELIARGYRGDVEHAARLDLYDCVPIMRGGRFEHMPPAVG